LPAAYRLTAYGHAPRRVDIAQRRRRRLRLDVFRHVSPGRAPRWASQALALDGVRVRHRPLAHDRAHLLVVERPILW